MERNLCPRVVTTIQKSYLRRGRDALRPSGAPCFARTVVLIGIFYFVEDSNSARTLVFRTRETPSSLVEDLLNALTRTSRVRMFDSNARRGMSRAHVYFCGEGGIRTLGTVARTHDFQSCTFGLSVTSPGLVLAVASPHEPSTCSAVAEREGFEPSVPVRVHLISNQVPSTARTSLRGRIWQRGRGLSMSWADIRFEFIGRPFLAQKMGILLITPLPDFASVTGLSRF